MTSIGAYDYAGLVKSYLTQSKPSGVTAKLSGIKWYRMSFAGTKLYSYQSQLAELDLANNVLLIDLCISEYSNTSVKQTNKLLFQLPNGMQVYYIDLANSPEQNLQYYWNRLDILIGKYTRARAEHTRASYKAQVHSLFNQAMSYADYAGIDRQSTVYLKYLEYTAKLFELKLL